MLVEAMRRIAVDLHDVLSTDVSPAVAGRYVWRNVGMAGWTRAMEKVGTQGWCLGLGRSARVVKATLGRRRIEHEISIQSTRQKDKGWRCGAVVTCHGVRGEEG